MKFKLPKIKLENLKTPTIIFVLLTIVGLSIKYALHNVIVERWCVLNAIGDSCGASTFTEIKDITTDLYTIDNSIKKVIESSCIAEQTATNQLIIKGRITNSNIKQSNLYKNLCSLQAIFNSDIDQTIKDNVSAAIASYAKTDGGFFGGAPATSNTVQESITNREYNIDNSQLYNSIQKCITNMKLENIIEIEESADITDSNIEQVNDFFLQCLALDSNSASLASEMENSKQAKFDAKSETKGGGMELVYIVLAIVALLIVGWIAKTIMFNTLANNTGSRDLSNAYIQQFRPSN